MPNPEDAALEPVNDVEAAFDFPFISASPGQQLTGSVKMKNTGTTTPWTSGTPPGTPPFHKLGLNPQTDLAWYPGPNRWPLPQPTVNPGQTATFTVTVTAPSTPGQYFLNFQMVRELPGQYAVFFGDLRASRYPRVLVLPTPPADKQNLVASEVLNTGAYLIDGVNRKRHWLNTKGQALKVKKVYLWTGALRTTVADIGVYVRRISDKSPLIYSQWDHYQEPTGPNHGLVQDFGADYMTLASTGQDGLEIEYLSNALLTPPPGGWFAQHLVVIWFEYP